MVRNFVRTRLSSVVWFAIVIFASLILFIHVGNMLSTEAQETEANFKSLLEELNQRMSSEGLLLTFELNSAVTDEANFITVGIGNTTDEISIRIDEIGEDYLCLRERRGVSLLIRCLPFSNIRSVTYLAN
jgi:hypothetical protein